MKKAAVIIGLGEVLWDVFPDGARFGGAPANFACHAASLGAEAWLVSAVGTDAEGGKAACFLQDHGVRCDALATDAAHPTGSVQVTLHGDGHPTYQIMENAAWDHLPWSAALGGLAPRAEAVCFGSLGQRSETARRTIQRFLAAVPDTALKMFDVNLRQHYFSAELLRTSLEAANAVKLNEDELPVLGRLFSLEGTDAAAQLGQLAERFDLRLVALTLGDRGAVLFSQGAMDEFQPPPVSVVDTVGAGDSFTAAVVTGFLEGLPLADINRHACAIAGFVCSSRGATPALPAALRQRPLTPITSS